MRRYIPCVKRMLAKLHRAGWSDVDIAIATSHSVTSARAWRTGRNNPRSYLAQQTIQNLFLRIVIREPHWCADA